MAIIAFALAGCGHSSGQGAPAASPSVSAAETASTAPSEAASVQATAAASQEGSTSGSPTPTPTPSPDPNLLAWSNGTIVRSYPANAQNDPRDFSHDGVEMPTPAPVTVVYELPGPATFTSFSAFLPLAPENAPSPSVDIAVGNSGATGSFQDVGTMAGNNETKTLTSSATGRWVRVSSNGQVPGRVEAFGTIAPLPSTVVPSGIYVESVQPYAKGVFTNAPSEASPWYRKVVTIGDSMTAVRCYDGRWDAPYPGTRNGRIWNFSDGGSWSQASINDDASLIVGSDGGGQVVLIRVNTVPKWCAPQTVGTGPHHVLVLDSEGTRGLWPVAENSMPGYTYTRMHASMFDQSALNGQEFAILNALCDASTYMSKGQTSALTDWVRAGHKLLIVDADVCPKSSYAFLPYPFLTSNPGAKGASGDRLIVVESDALGATDKTDTAHYFDPQVFINHGSNQLGDANIVTTQDPHWCGHLFGTNANNDNGFTQMYAPYGQGIIIYDGFDEDDGGNLGYERVRTLEFLLPLPAGMPCSQSVASSFLVQPSQEATFKTGTAQTLNFNVEALASLGWKGHVTVQATGDLTATVTPAAFDLAGTTQSMKVAIHVPASTKAGVYTVTVTGSDGAGHTSAATITLTATAPLVKKIQKHQRIRIYGIHFDVDSAHIQPQSEKVVKEIADLMKANPTVRFQVEGHTDSDGGAAYNLGLSQRRAQAVVNDLVTRYGIARSRLVPKGFGLTEPVKPNTTAANKALNRRVELLAL